MFGIGLPEMLVILAVALIVVGPDKLPELAKSLAKGLNELKKTVNQVRSGLSEEENVLNEVKGEIDKTVADLQRDLIDTKNKTKKSFPEQDSVISERGRGENIIEMSLLSDERPWEKDRKKVPDTSDHAGKQEENETKEKEKKQEQTATTEETLTDNNSDKGEAGKK
jgi:sec-independent protein translocase protein TatB